MARNRVNIEDLLIGSDPEIVWWAAQSGDVAMINYAVEHLHAPLDVPNPELRQQGPGHTLLPSLC